MADRPIIFSAPMVRALLDGQKTQTRRVLKLAGRAPEYIGPIGCQDDPTCWGWDHADGGYITVAGDDNDHLPGWRDGWRDWSGAYAPGDRLWVREAVCWVSAWGWRYRADNDDLTEKREAGEVGRWRPSIHMPRWASRLTLTVTDVRVQRLQDISEADAIAEGGDATRVTEFHTLAMPSFIAGFQGLWNSLHGPGAWDANPWVVALTFDVVRGNIDQMPGVAG